MVDKTVVVVTEEYDPKDVCKTGWKAFPTFKDLDNDYQAAKGSHDEYVATLELLRENMKGGKPVKARTGKSTHRPLVIRKSAEYRYPLLSEPLLNTDDMFIVQPRTAEDTKPAEQNEMMLNYYWATQVDKVGIVDTAVRRFVDEGTVVIKTGWKAEEDEVLVEQEVPVYASAEESLMLIQEAVQSGKMPPEQAQAMLESGQPVQTGVELKLVPEMKLVENCPSYEVCDNESIILDPTANGRKEDLKFLIHEYETDISTLKDQEAIVDHVKTSDGKVVEEVNGVYHNLDKIRLDGEYEREYGDTNSRVYENSQDFQFEDNPRKKLVAYEYWGEWDIDGNGTTEPIVATWIQKVLIRLERNPFPHKSIPFSIAAYMPIKGDLRGEPDGALLIENQNMIGNMMRAANDITTTHAIGQKLVQENLFSNSSEWDAYMAGNDARFQANVDPKQAIHQANVERVDPSVFQMIDLYTQDGAQMTGTSAAQTAASGSSGVYKNQASVRSAMDASSKRELGVLRRLIIQGFNDMGSKTIQNQQVYASSEEVLRVTNTEFVVVRREDLQGEFDLSIDVSTPEAESEKAERLNMLMQTNQANMDPGLQKIFYTEILRLWKMPEAEKAVEEFEPQPDPAAEEMKQIQLQKARLELQEVQLRMAETGKKIEDMDSKIIERLSRADENKNSDIEMKQAQAASFRAQAEKLIAESEKLESESRKLESEADLLDEEQISVNSGEKREQVELDNEFQAQNKREDMIIQGKMNEGNKLNTGAKNG